MNMGSGYQNKSESLSAEFYLEEAGKFKPLSKEQEVALFDAYESGDESARDKIILHHQRFAIKSAFGFYGSRLPFEDLVQEANVALIRAFDKYDRRVGIRFLTYARWTVRSALQEVSTRAGYPVALPYRTWRPALNILNKRREMEWGTTKSVSTLEAAREIGKIRSHARVAQVMDANHVPDVVEIDGDYVSIIDLAGEHAKPNQLAGLEQADMKMAVERLLESTTDGRRDVAVRTLEHIREHGEVNNTAVAQEFGCTRQNIEYRLREIGNRARTNPELAELADVLK